MSSHHRILLSTFAARWVHLMGNFRILRSSYLTQIAADLTQFAFISLFFAIAAAAVAVCYFRVFFLLFLSLSLFQSICCRYLGTNNEQKADTHDRCRLSILYLNPSDRPIVEHIQITINRLNSIFYFPSKFFCSVHSVCCVLPCCQRICLAIMCTSDFIHHSEMIESNGDR